MASAGRQLLRSASAIVCKPIARSSHVLRIDGYSHLKEMFPNWRFVPSSDFHVGGHAWRLQYYPNGCNSEYKDHISAFLQLASEPEDGEHVPVRAEFRLLDQLGNPVDSTRKSCKVHSFTERDDTLGYRDFVTRAKLEKPKHLKDDCVAIQCDVSVTAVRSCPDDTALMYPQYQSSETI